MANEFKVKKGLIVDGTNTVLDIQGTQGQLFSVTDSLTGDLFSVSDISGVPILNVNSSGSITTDGSHLTILDGHISLKQSTDSGFTTGLTIERSANTQKLHIGMDGGAVNFNSPDGLAYKFRNNGTEKFTVDGSGNATFAGDINVGANYIGRDSTDMIDFSGDNQMAFRANNASRVTIDAAQMYPNANNSYNLGHGSFRWNNLYFGDGSIIDFNGDVTLTHSSNTLTVGGANTFHVAGAITGLSAIFDSTTAFSLTSKTGDTIMVGDDTAGSSAVGDVGGSIGFSGPQTGTQRQAAIAALRTGTDHDQIGLAFYTHPGTSNDETIVKQLTINHDGGATFAGTVASGAITSTSNIESRDTFILNYNNAGNKWQQLFDGSNGWNLRYYNGTSWSSNYVNVNTSGNATFAGTINSGAITSTGKITGTELEGTSLDINGVANINPGTNANIPLELFSDNAGCYVRYDDGDNANRWYTGVNSGIYRVYNNSNVAVFSLNASNNATFAGTVTGTTLTGTSLDINGNADISGTLDVHGNLSLQDNDKLNIGASDDLQIYHDGSDSYIDDTGTGWLRLRGNGGVILSSYSEGETMLQATRNGAVTLYYDNAAKLATVTGGVVVTGELEATTLDINGAAAINGKVVIEGDSANWSTTTPGLTTGSLHFDPGASTNDFGNAITFGASDAGSGANAQAGIYIRSDGNYGTRMYFATTDSYATGSKVAFYINNNKKVYFNDDITVAGDVEGASLDINGNAAIDGLTTLTNSAHPLVVNRTGGAAALIHLQINGTSEGYIGATSTKSFVVYNESAAERFSVSNAGLVTATNDVVAFSDRKLKENIETLDGKKVLDMRGVSFTRKDTGAESSGVIAQEIQKVAPELVHDTEGTLGVAYGNLVGYLIEAVKDQQKQIDELKAMINGNS